MGRRKRHPAPQAQNAPGHECRTAVPLKRNQSIRSVDLVSILDLKFWFGLLLISLTILAGWLARPQRQADHHLAADSWECKEGCQDDAYGGQEYYYAPSRGFHAAGCRWREVSFNDSQDVLYEYWAGQPPAWQRSRPIACTLMAQAKDVPEDYEWNKATEQHAVHATPATAVLPKDTHVLMKNLWYNNGRWYALVEDGERHVDNIKISRNQQITCLHVKNATRWAANTKHVLIQRHTLLFDYIYFQHPTAIGHWMEMMFPLSSILKNSTFRPPDVNVILLHLKRKHLMEWSRAVMATTLNVAARQALPPIWLQQETDILTEQPTMPLEGVPADLWVAFDTVMIIRDLFTGGKRSFKTTADAREFRAGIYHNHGLSVPPSTPHTTPPQYFPLDCCQLVQRITYQRKRANRRIVNEAEILQLLETYAPVDIVEFNSSHSFQTQIEAMARTGIFVGTHTSNLANTAFLPPGSAVVELIQRFWYWMNLDKSFKDQTDQLADVHHFAWRAFHANQTVYLSARDKDRFSNWTSAQCRIQDCVEAHTNVDVIVDVPELKAMLDARLPRVLAGASVPELASVWPSNEPGQAQPWRVPPGQTS